MRMQSVEAGTYRVYIGDDVFRELNRQLNYTAFKHAKIFVLVDEHTLKHCYPIVLNAVKRLREAEIIEIESGEESKNIDVCRNIWSALSALGADRQSLLINIGGGVIGDIGGFAAATFKRGIPFINIPTTLLAQVDASVGGKLGIDLDALKNEIGVFGDPAGVFIYPGFLSTLPKRQLFSGFAEVIKHAIISDKKYWKQVQD
ncbi:MAG TPA: iron-containing alcohol dehydrogenase, partial [Bacteroidia bacterium]